jgi:hypothetical protein
MKKFLLFIVVSLFSITASAQYMHWHSRYGPYYEPVRSWVGPLIIGGAIGYSINKSQQPNTIIVQQPNIVVEQHMECTPWREIQQSDGTITRERTCYQK